MHHASNMTAAWGLLVLAGVLTGCGGGSDASSGDAALRPVPRAQPAELSARRLPIMKPATVRTDADQASGRAIEVRVLIEGRVAGDSVKRAASPDAACGDSLTDWLVIHNGAAVVGALVWVEGPTAVHARTSSVERRTTVTLEHCQLQPRVQVAPLGSTLQLVMRDARAASLVVVPVPPSLSADTISFLTDGQLVPVRRRTDSAGVLAIHATQRPWSRAYVAITPPAVSAISDGDGMARFTLDRSGRLAVLRVWHPSLGLMSATIDPSTVAENAVVTLTFKP